MSTKANVVVWIATINYENGDSAWETDTDVFGSEAEAEQCVLDFFIGREPDKGYLYGAAPVRPDVGTDTDTEDEGLQLPEDSIYLWLAEDHLRAAGRAGYEEFERCYLARQQELEGSTDTMFMYMPPMLSANWSINSKQLFNVDVDVEEPQS